MAICPLFEQGSLLGFKEFTTLLLDGLLLHAKLSLSNNSFCVFLENGAIFGKI